MTVQPPIDTPASLESDRHFLGQRRVNLIWETTQAIIALAVSLGTLYPVAVRHGGDS